MKIDKVLKILLIILLIVLVSIISFAGLNIQEKNKMVNLLADYKLGMDIKGARVVIVEVDDTVNTTYYDKNGKVVEKEDKNGRKEEIPVNDKELLTKENYLETKKIIEKRLNDLGIQEFLIRQDEENGKLTIQIPEDSFTDLAIQYLYTTGKFEVVDEDGNVLLDNQNLKEASVSYSTTQTGTIVYLNIEFNKDSIEKLKEITANHLTTKDEEGKDTSKKVTLKLDGDQIISTSFDKEIVDGVISLSVGGATTDNEALQSSYEQASHLAILLNNGNFKISYNVTQNRYIQSDITMDNINFVALIVIIIVVIACIVLVVIYKKNGLLAAIAHIGYTAVLLIIIRYTNAILTVEGLVAIRISMILNYMFSIYLLQKMKKAEIEKEDESKAYNKAVIKMIFVLIPAMVVGITSCFARWMPIYSFGEIIFWGILTMFIYNTVITRTLLLCSTKNK